MPNYNRLNKSLSRYGEKLKMKNEKAIKETLLNQIIAQIEKEQAKQKDFKHLAIRTKTFKEFREHKNQKGFKSDTETIDFFIYLSKSNDRKAIPFYNDKQSL